MTVVLVAAAHYRLRQSYEVSPKLIHLQPSDEDRGIAVWAND